MFNPFSRREYFIHVRMRAPIRTGVWVQMPGVGGFWTEKQARKDAQAFVEFAYHQYETLYDYRVRKEPYVRRRNRV